MSGVTSLITCEELNGLLSTGADDVMVFETGMWERKDCYQQSVKEHIKSAQYLDLWEGIEATYLFPINLPEPEKFQEYSRKLGINNNTHVVLYDREMYFAARLWYQFKTFGHVKVSVLDGGIQHWIKQGMPTESGTPHDKPRGDFTIRGKLTDLFKDYNHIVNEALPRHVQILDVRKPCYFEGASKDLPEELVGALEFAGLPPKLKPEDLLTGHLPGSVNIENMTFIDPETNCMVSPEQLTRMLREVNLDVTKPMLVTCYLGVSACLVPLAASRLASHGEMTVYGGSWTEYSQKSSIGQVETGPAITQSP